MTQCLNEVLYAMWEMPRPDLTCSIGMMAIQIIVVHNLLQRHRLYGFPMTSISPENLHHFYCMVQQQANFLDSGQSFGSLITRAKHAIIETVVLRVDGWLVSCLFF